MGQFLNLFWYDGVYHMRILIVPGVEVFLMTILTAVLLRRLIQG